MLPKPSANKSLIVAGVLCVLSLVAMLLALTLGQQQILEEFTPPPFDTNACAGVPDMSVAVSWKEFDAEIFRVFVCGEIKPIGNIADIWLTNPVNNTVWMKMRILDMDGNILGETGLIMPGEYIREIHLNKVPEAGTPIVLKIMTYEPETYHSAGSISINTAIY